jgi:hypothetical protein
MTVEEDPDMAPKYVYDHSDRMSYLLKNPFKNVNFDRIKLQKSERHGSLRLPEIGLGHNASAVIPDNPSTRLVSKAQD